MVASASSRSINCMALPLLDAHHDPSAAVSWRRHAQQMASFSMLGAAPRAYGARQPMSSSRATNCIAVLVWIFIMSHQLRVNLCAACL